MSKEVAVKAKYEVADFAIFQDSSFSIKELIEDNLGGEEFKPEDLTKISVPSGGGLTFEFPDGSTSNQIEAIIVKVEPIRLYWKEAYGTGEVGPPDCRSIDMVNGIGEPGGSCAICPLNEFGTAAGNAKACKEKRNIFILTPESLLPYNLSAPVQSIKNYKKYLQHLTRKAINIKSLVTIIGLEKDKSNQGIAYSRLTFAEGPKLNEDQVKFVTDYRKAFAGVASVAPNAAAPSFDD
jgi:hypothetical protein